MKGRATAHELTRPACAVAGVVALVLCLVVWPAVAGAQVSADSILDTLQQQLPPPLNGEVLPIPAEPATKHLVPLAPPISDQDFQIVESDGLISLSVRNASIRQVVGQIAETQDFNMVFAAPEDVSVTATFERVPWTQALDSLLSATGHTWTDNGGIIFITSVSMAGSVAPQAGGRHVHVFELDFASAVDIDQTVKGLLSPAGSSWVLEGSSDDNRRTREAVAVVDYPANLTQIADYICQADQPPRQVMIEAHILAVELNDDCRNGIFWEQILGVAGNQGNLGFVSPGVFNVTNPQLGDPGNNSTGFIVIDTPKLSSIVEMLQSTTDAKTLASPRLLVVSGQEANIQIGEKIGYRETTTTQTSSLESVKFLDVGVVLSVTPRITRDGRVLMRVKPEVSTGQLNATTGLPNEETTEVQSDVLLEDGHGMVIGGLIQEKDENTQNKVPWLGDIPYAGVLFQRRQVVKSRTEIIVTLIPHIQPYHPTLAHRNDHDFMRTAEPLTYGPLHRFPRPYEPRMPDTFTNPRTLRQNVASLPRPMTGHRDMVRLPPIESESVECVAVSVGVDVETLPTSAAEPELEIVNPLETRRLPRVFR